MSIQDWGAIGDLVGAIAVVITLIYLAIQVRHSKQSLDANTKAIRGQVISDVTKNMQDHMAMVVQGRDVASAVQKMATEDELEPDDALILDMLLTAIFVARQNEYFQWKQGTLDESVFRSLHHIIFTILATPSGIHWWRHEGSKLVAPEFVEFVDQLVAENLTSPLSSWRAAIHVDKSE